MYQQALDFLFSQLPMFSRVGAAAYKPGLDTTLALDEAFGHPHRHFKTIHIAGTNGKGSTSHTIAAILQAQGYKTGLYTSPHLADFRERMRINGEMIPQEDVVEFVRRWRELESGIQDSKFRIQNYKSPSFFELTMMMAFDWFAKERVDYAVIEVGMGGRLDSTNIITPEVCAITNISNDHTQFLGNTLREIASEKAGIIKPGIPVVIGEAEGEIREVFERKAAETCARATFAEDSPLCTSVTKTPGGWECASRFGTFTFPLGGDYQKKNIETALYIVSAMRDAGIEISDESIVKGMSEVDVMTGLRGRWTVVSDSPLTIADTGHNVAGIAYNMNQLAALMAARPDGKLRMVMGFVADKALDKILPMLPKDAEYYFTNASIPRALPVGKLEEMASEYGLKGRAYHSVKEAAQAAGADAGLSDIVFIGGSTFVVADYFAG